MHLTCMSDLANKFIYLLFYIILCCFLTIFYRFRRLTSRTDASFLINMVLSHMKADKIIGFRSLYYGFQCNILYVFCRCSITQTWLFDVLKVSTTGELVFFKDLRKLIAGITNINHNPIAPTNPVPPPTIATAPSAETIAQPKARSSSPQTSNPAP